MGGTPPDEASEADETDEAPAARPWGWWVALALALAFLGGTVGYLVGTRSADPQSTFGDVDRGFLNDMISHHDQAVEMSLLAQGQGADPVTESFAEEVITFQRWETGIMDEMLAQAGSRRAESDPDRTTMAWMHMGTPLRSMPGMASEEQLDELAAATGADSDRRFLTLMRDHHEGGIHMAEYAAEHADNPRVRALAARMAHNQGVEVNEYTLKLEQLGFE
jgi:uncharacterized protein (DUF305 family)